jgi:NAD(P)-dependent dehydrogenase (short-subunit alcohol dehydrogenase family)
MEIPSESPTAVARRTADPKLPLAVMIIAALLVSIVAAAGSVGAVWYARRSVRSSATSAAAAETTAALDLTKTLSQEFGPRGIRVNAVSPGLVATDLWLGEHGVARTVAKATGVDADAARETIIAGIGGFATGRFTTPEEVATLITFLASERAANITGANYVIDGGLIKTT